MARDKTGTCGRGKLCPRRRIGWRLGDFGSVIFVLCAPDTLFLSCRFFLRLRLGCARCHAKRAATKPGIRRRGGCDENFCIIPIAC